MSKENIEIPKGNTPEARQKRMNIIRQYAGRMKGDEVYCPVLGAKVVINGTGIGEMIEHSSKSYLSTMAVLDLKHQIAIAKFFRYHIPKDNKQKKRGYLFMIELHGDLDGKATKIIVGVKLTAQYKHYCITTLE